MALTLNNFKRTIPGNILTRGREYYNQGLVIDLSLEDEDTWVAEVQGTEQYEVRIAQTPDGELDCSCTCPYEYGEHCKHVAAVLYAIEEAFPEYLEGKRRKPARKRTTRLDKLRAALEAAPPDQLIGILLQLAGNDRELLNQLLLSLDATGDRPADYRRLVKDAVRPPPGSRGFLDYRDSTQAGIRVGEIVDRADKAQFAHPEQSVMIYQIALEETTAALGHADDSSGALSDNITRAFNGLAASADRLTGKSRDALFRYCLDEATGPRYAGWGWGWNLLEVAADLVDSPTQRAALYEAVAAIRKPRANHSYSTFSSQYDDERAAAIQLKVIRRLEGEEAAIAFITDRKHLDRFRMALIQHHFDRGDLETVRALAEEGIALSQQNGRFQPRRAIVYRQFILEAAMRQGDTPAVIEQARTLWLRRQGDNYYVLLQESIPPAEWAAYRDRLLTSKECDDDLAAWAYAREGLWAEVRDLVLDQPHFLEAYHREMEKRFPNETAAAYRRIVVESLAEASNRPTYRAAANYLERMKRLGHAEQAGEIAQAFIKRYPQRRAMIEELQRV